MAERATHTLGATIASGATAVRSHAQVDTDCGLERLEGVLAARGGTRPTGRRQVVAFPQSGILRDRGTADLLDAAVRAGADLVGGLDPCAFDRDPVGHLDVVFGIAQRHGVGVDIHLHEAGELGAFTIELIAERTAALGMQGLVTISHAFALGDRRREPSGGLIELLAKEDIALTTVAPGNAGRCRWRRCAPAESGSVWARTASGTTGRRTATATCWSGHGSWPSATASAGTARRAVRRRGITRGRAIVGGTRWSPVAITDDTVTGLAAGAVADLVVVAADTVTAAVMDHPPRTLVIRGGEVIARDGRLC